MLVACRLKNREVLYVLMNHQSLELEFAKEVVCPPSSGLLVLYDKNIVKRFRRDEHGEWRRSGKGISPSKAMEEEGRGCGYVMEAERRGGKEGGRRTCRS